jgi:hypothetical protein
MKNLIHFRGESAYRVTKSNWLQIFYFGLFVICLNEWTIVGQLNLESFANPTWVWGWLNLESTKSIYQWLVFVTLSLALLNTISNSFKSRLLLSLSLWLMDSFKASFNKVDHNMIGWCWAATLLIFHKDEISLAYRIHQAQVLVLINYFLAIIIGVRFGFGTFLCGLDLDLDASISPGTWRRSMLLTGYGSWIG